jgi:hypothetical protein
MINQNKMGFMLLYEIFFVFCMKQKNKKKKKSTVDEKGF